MSNTDFDEGDFDPTDFIARQQRASRMYALGSLADDPEKAARAVELGDATGDKPALIYGNLENYEEQHKAALTASLLNSNKYLREYVDADPMHAKISNDGYASLDDISESLQKLALPKYKTQTAIAGGIFGGAIEGFKRGWSNVTNPQHVTDEELRKYPLFTAIMQSARFPVDLGAAVLEGGVEAIKQGTKAGYQSITGDEMGAEKFSREMAGMAETVLTGTSGFHSIDLPPEQLAKVHGIVDKAKPWLDDSKEPPRGLDPEIDKRKFEQNKLDLDNLDEALKKAQSDPTRERSPEIFASFIRQHSDASIGISGDAVAKLYGDKVPEAGDGILGWSPGIAEEIRTAVATGGDVQVPLADWLAKVDPEVAKELHDDIRVRPGGVTKNEKEAEAEAKKAPGDNFKGEPLPNAGLVPANMAPDGTIYVGTKNSQHFELSRKYGADIRKEQGLQPGEGTWKDTGFVTPDGKFLNRQEAFDWVTANEKQIKPSENMEGIGLDALDYREQVPEGRRKKLQPPQPSKPTEIIPEPLPSVRGASGLEPMFSIGDRKLTLEKRPVRERAFAIPEGYKPTEFRLLDENGKSVGYVE